MENKQIPWPGIIRSNHFNDAQKHTFEMMCKKYKISGQLNESILSRMRLGLDNLRKAGNVGLDEETIDRLQDIMTSSSKFATYMDEQFRKSYDKILAYYKTGLEKPKTELLLKIRRKEFDYPKDNIDQEITDLSKLCVFWLKDFKNILSEQNRAKFAKCLIAESVDNSADVVLVLESFDPTRINENDNRWSFLDRASSAVASTEPFKTINSIAGLRTSINNTSLNKFAELSHKLGAPKCIKLTAVGSIAGKLAQLREKQLGSADILKNDPILRFLPAGPAMIEVFELVACATAVLEIMEELKTKK